MTGDTRRLFFALSPDDQVRNKLISIQRQIGEISGRWIAGENLHLTLIFLGQVPGEKRVCIERAALAVRISRFELILDEIGYWSRSGILSVKPHRVPPALPALVEHLANALSACGFSQEERQYRPHITLARDLHKKLGQQRMEPIHWPVTHFTLMASNLRGRLVNYEVVQAWSLKDQSKE